MIDIRGVHLTNPLFYTQKYLTNDFVKANDLAKHIHLFNHQISHIDYDFFKDLKGLIKCINEDKSEIINDGVIRSAPFEFERIGYFFNENLEFYEMTVNSVGSMLKVSLVENLRTPKMKIVKQYIHGKLLSEVNVLFDNVLEYEQIEKSASYLTKPSIWKRNPQRTVKYNFRLDDIVQKVILRNGYEEQSKTAINFGKDYQVINSKTFSQKNKTELLYESTFHYDYNRLKEITYIRYNSSSRYSSFYPSSEIPIKANFEYNVHGLLEKFTDFFMNYTLWEYDANQNPICKTEYNRDGQIEWKTTYSYIYDSIGNWISKDSFIYRGYRHKEIRNIKQLRQIEYFE